MLAPDTAVRMGKSGNGEVVLHHRRQRRRVSDDEARQQTRLIRRECSRARSRETNAHHTRPSLIPGHFSHRDGRPFGRDHGERGIATPWLTRPATNREALPWNNFEPRRTGRPDGDQAASGVPAVLGSHRIDGCPEDDLTLTHRAGEPRADPPRVPLRHSPKLPREKLGSVGASPPRTPATRRRHYTRHRTAMQPT